MAYGTALRVENSKVDSAVITALGALMSVEGVNADSAPIAALRQRSDERATASLNAISIQTRSAPAWITSVQTY